MIDTWLDILHWYHHGSGEVEVVTITKSKRETLLGFLSRCNHNIYYKIEGKIMILWKQ